MTSVSSQTGLRVGRRPKLTMQPDFFPPSFSHQMNVFLYQDDEWQQGENVGIGVVMVFVGSESIFFFLFFYFLQAP